MDVGQHRQIITTINIKLVLELHQIYLQLCTNTTESLSTFLSLTGSNGLLKALQLYDLGNISHRNGAGSSQSLVIVLKLP